jgi:hypothetical protein
MKKLILALTLISTSLQAQTYTQLQWGVNKGVNPYQFGANINGTWSNLGTVTPAGVWNILGSAVSFVQSGTNAITRTMQNKVREVQVSVTDFAGADNTCATDSSAAFNSAIAALPATGGTLVIPAGCFKISSTINVTKSLNIVGNGVYGTLIQAGSATADLFYVTTGGFFMSDLAINSPTITRTAGAYVRTNNISIGEITNVLMLNWYVALNLDSTTIFTVSQSSFRNGTPATTSAGSCGIQIGNTGLSTTDILYDITMDNNPALRPDCGIRLRYSDGFQGSMLNIINTNNDLLLDPQSGQFTTATWVNNSFLDTGGTGIRLAPGVGGNIVEANFSQVWASSHDNTGVVLDGRNGGVLRTTFTDLVANLNNNDGVKVLGQFAISSRFDNLKAAQNIGAGISFASSVGTADTSVVPFTVVNSNIGKQNSINGNTYGIYIDGTVAANYVVQNNILQGNSISNYTDLKNSGLIFGNVPIASIPHQSFGPLVINSANNAFFNTALNLQAGALFNGATSGTIGIYPQAVAGSYNFNLPTTVGTAGYLLTSQGGGSTAMTWTSPTITINSTACTLGSSCTVPTTSITLPVTVSGTVNSGGIPYFNSATQMSSSAALAQYQLVIGGGAGAAPATLGATGSSGQLLQSSGAASNPSWTTATYPTATTAGTILASGTANTVTATATPTLGASGTLGSITMGNATSGTVTLQPATGALGTVTASLPANTGTIAETNIDNAFTSNQTISSTSANALAVGANGSTNPALKVDASTASSATGVQIKSVAAGGNAAITAISSGTNEALTIDAKGSGIISLGAGSTGNVGIKTTTPLYTLGFPGDSGAFFIGMNRRTTAASPGNSLNFVGGGATSGATNQNGGSVIFNGGVSTGTGTSNIQFWTAPAGASGTADNSLVNSMIISGNGLVGILQANPANNIDINSGSAGIRFGQTASSAYYDFNRDISDGYFKFNGAQATFVGYKFFVTSVEKFRISATGSIIGTTNTANSLAIGPNGTTNPSFNVDASTASAATGVNIKSAAAAGGVAVSTISSGTNENMTIDAKGSGTITLNNTATGHVAIGRPLLLKTYTIATLPSCSATLLGATAVVSDGTAYATGTYGSAVSATDVVSRQVLCTNTAGATTYAWAYN